MSTNGGEARRPRRPRVVVVGAGFAGLQVARRLADTPCDVLILDRRNHHVFQPLLYQVATAALSPADIAAPIRSILRRQANAMVGLGEVTVVDPAAREIRMGDVPVAYDWLVLAAGATHAYFGHDEWADRAPGLKSVEDALEIRRRVLLAFEEAEIEQDDASRKAKLTFVVVGGGPTGVEMAGALREIAAETIPEDFRRVDTATARIVLLEGGPRLIASMSDEASARALEDLRQMGVDVRLNTFVTRMDEDRVWAGDESFPAANVIWAAGVQASPVVAGLGVPLDPQGRVLVESDCSIPGDRHVFVVGDLASLSDPETGERVPGVAQGAIQMGQFVGDILRAEIEREGGSPARPAFRYRDKGNMATIGRAKAVADVSGHTFGGFVAWLLWSLIHVFFLVGFRNRIIVMVNWAWQWIVQARGARLITGASTPNVEKHPDLGAPPDS